MDAFLLQFRDKLRASLCADNLLEVELGLLESLSFNKVIILHHVCHIWAPSRSQVLCCDLERLFFGYPRGFLELHQVIHRVFGFVDVFNHPVVELVELNSLLQGSVVHFDVILIFDGLAEVHLWQISLHRVNYASEEFFFVDGCVLGLLYSIPVVLKFTTLDLVNVKAELLMQVMREGWDRDLPVE